MSQFNVQRSKFTIHFFKILVYFSDFLLINNKEKYLLTKISKQIIKFLTFLLNLKIFTKQTYYKINQKSKIQ